MISIILGYLAAQLLALFIDQGASQWRTLVTTILSLAMIAFFAWLLRAIDSKTHILPSNRRALMEPDVPLSISVNEANANLTANVTLHTGIYENPQAEVQMAKASTVMIEILHSCEEHYKKFDRPCNVTLKEPKGAEWLLSIIPSGLTPRDVEKIPVQIFGMTLLVLAIALLIAKTVPELAVVLHAHISFGVIAALIIGPSLVWRAARIWYSRTYKICVRRASGKTAMLVSEGWYCFHRRNFSPDEHQHFDDYFIDKLKKIRSFKSHKKGAVLTIQPYHK